MKQLSNRQVAGQQPQTETAERMGLFGWSILFVLTLSAFVMRFYRLAEVPPGLFYDEAFNGLDAHHLLNTPLWDWPIFFTGNHGREPLLIWTMGISHALFGQSIWTIRFVPALCGALLTPALAWLGWEAAPLLGVRHRRTFALWSGAAVLALLWSQIFSRYGIRLSFFVLLQALMWAALWRAWGSRWQVAGSRWQVAGGGWMRSRGAGEQEIGGAEERGSMHPEASRTMLWWGLAGAFAGLSFYTYLPARLAPLILLPLIVVALWQHRDRVRDHGQGILLGTLVALVVAAPLGIYFIQNPVSFTTRIGQVSVVGREGEGIGANLAPVAGMFAWTGDHNPRANVPYRPALDPLLAPFFAVGLILALWRFWRLGYLWLSTGLFVMLLPTLLSEFAPNYQRAIGALPFVVLLVALGLDGAVRLGRRLWRRGQPLYLGAGWILLVASIALTWRAYFVTWAASPDLFPAWDVGFTRIAEQIVANDRGVRVYVSPRGQEHPTIAYLLGQYPGMPIPEGFDGRICLRVATDVPAHYYFLDNEDFRGKPLVNSYYPDADLRTTVWDVTGAPWADKLAQPLDGQVVFPEMIAQASELSDGIDLLGYWIYPEDGIQPGQLLYTRLYWRVVETPGRNYTAFSHLVRVDATGAATPIAGADRPPGEGTCPTLDWLSGEVVIDELQFMVPANLDPAAQDAYYLEVGFYTPEDGKRLDVPDNAEDRVLIGPLPIGVRPD